jgi:hypothetical protein
MPPIIISNVAEAALNNDNHVLMVPNLNLWVYSDEPVTKGKHGLC